jgi:hypothetical protein
MFSVFESQQVCSQLKCNSQYQYDGEYIGRSGTPPGAQDKCYGALSMAAVGCLLSEITTALPRHQFTREKVLVRGDG